MPRPPRLALACTCTLVLLAACTGDPALSTDTGAGSSSATGDSAPTVAATGDTGDTGDLTTGAELPPLQGVADLHLHMFAEEAFGGGWFHGSHRGAGEDALAPCDGGEPGDHARLKSELAPLLGTCEDMTLEDLGKLVPLVAVISAPGGSAMARMASISSDTVIVPSSAVIADPLRPATMTAVRSGPISRVTATLTRSAT